MATYNTVVLAQRPKGDIKAGETFKLKAEKRISEADLEDGQVLVESIYLSLDPAMRGWLNGMMIIIFLPNTLPFFSSLSYQRLTKINTCFFPGHEM